MVYDLFMNNNSTNIFRLDKYYQTFIYFLNKILKGNIIIVNEETNKFYLKFCKKINEILENPEFEKLRNEDWRPFENIRVNELDIEWEYGGSQMCQRFLSLIEEQSLDLEEPKDFLTKEDIEFFNSFEKYLIKYLIYKEIEVSKFDDEMSKRIEIIKKENILIKNMDINLTNNEDDRNKIFLGHGHSKIWLELKSFIQDRLKLPWEEFNRISAAGIPTQIRLNEMLNNSCFAFIILTGEDETLDGKIRARENVVHETGLFQGKLGFNKAIILLEEGCEEFSNIHGLGQIRFPKNEIKSIFEDIRKTLERENIISTNG